MVGDLSLKIVAHSGEALFTRVGEHPTLSGPDVITVHRLAKNDVDSHRYLLMTGPAYRDLASPPEAEPHGSIVLDTGEFDLFLVVPEVVVRDDPEFIRSRFSNENAAVQILRDEIKREYTDVANNPDRGYHFNVGRSALSKTGYDPQWFEGAPEVMVKSFAGTGNPFSMGLPREGEYVIDIGSGSGLDAVIAAQAVGPAGHVVGVEMTEAMLDTARAGAEELGLDQLEFRVGFTESLPFPDGWADLVISNGVINLSPEKSVAFAEINRVLRPGGRIQIGDITVNKPIPEGARRNIDLWTN